MLTALLLTAAIAAQSHQIPFNPEKPFGLDEYSTEKSLDVYREARRDADFTVNGFRFVLGHEKDTWGDGILCGYKVIETYNGNIVVLINGKAAALIIKNSWQIGETIETVTHVKNKYYYELINYYDKRRASWNDPYKDKALAFVFNGPALERLHKCLWTGDEEKYGYVMK